MTIANDSRQQQILRLKEFAQLSRQRYLEQGGNPHLSVGSFNNNDCLTEEEKQEFSNLLNQVVADEDINDYLQRTGTWRERMDKTKS